jgi:hypothetical protein
MKKELNFFILLIFSLINNILTFNCGTNELNHITLHQAPLPTGSRHLDSEFSPIRIKMDYTYLESQGKSKDLTNKIENVLDKTVSDFEKLLTIRHINFKYTEDYLKKFCGINVFDKNYDTWGDFYDIVIVPYFNDTLNTSAIQAAATACVAITNTLQPKMGIIMINPKLDFSQTNSEKFLELLFLHEMSHVLIFHPSFFLFLDMLGEKTFNREKRYYIKTPKVLEKARLHFGCNSIDGIYLENYGGQGSSGSHWESRYMLGDYMIATDYPEIVISDITLAVFEDSGYYKVNYYTGGLFRFGKGEGCDFFNEKCVINGATYFKNEFCVNSQEPFCSSSHLAKGHCYMARYNQALEDYHQYFSQSNVGGYAPADYCPISFDNLYDKTNYYFATNCRVGKQNTIHKDYGEKIGDNSICVESSLVPTSSNQIQTYRSICYEVSCDKTNSNVILNIGGSKVVCPMQGGLLKDPNGFNGKVMCPDYNSICTSSNWCNDPLVCIEKRITSDESSYIYKYNLRDEVEKSNYLNELSFTYLFLLIAMIFI